MKSRPPGKRISPDAPGRDAVGIGFRREMHDALLEEPTTVGFLEVIAENYLGASVLPRDRLGDMAARYPIVGHGVSLNLLGAEPLDDGHLARLAALVRRYRMAWFSDHLCWSASGGHRHHDLLPAPYASELVPYVAARARRVQDAIGVPFGIENLSSYVTWRRGDLSEWEFYRRVVEESGCWYMLDINNLYVSSMNHGFDPMAYLRSVRWDRVMQVHLAGHLVRPDGIRHDTHDRPVCDEVWGLYREAWRMGGPFPTLIEWDDRIPSAEEVLAEAERAVEVRSR